MTPRTHDQDITSWLRLLSAIEEAEAGHGTARLAEICLSAYGELAVTAKGPRLHPHLPTHRQRHPARGR